MLDRLTLLGAFALDALWLPLACWTLVAAAALLADRARPVRAPLVRRDVLMLVLWALPVGLVLRHVWSLRATLPVPIPPCLLYTSPSPRD